MFVGEPATLDGGELSLMWTNAHDAVVGASQEENVLFLKTQLGRHNYHYDDVEEEEDQGERSKIDDTYCHRTGSEDQAC